MTPSEVGAPGAGVEAGTEAQGTTDTAQFTGQPVDLQADTATVIARALLAGVAIRELPTGAFVVTRQGLRWRCADLAAVLALLRRMGGAS